jgi:hypothetical protein
LSWLDATISCLSSSPREMPEQGMFHQSYY